MGVWHVAFIISVTLVVIGALNWGWIGLFEVNPISELNSATFNSVALERTIYVLVGLSGLALAALSIYMIWCDHKKTKVKMANGTMSWQRS